MNVSKELKLFHTQTYTFKQKLRFFSLIFCTIYKMKLSMQNFKYILHITFNLILAFFLFFFLCGMYMILAVFGLFVVSSVVSVCKFGCIYQTFPFLFAVLLCSVGTSLQTDMACFNFSLSFLFLCPLQHSVIKRMQVVCPTIEFSSCLSFFSL